MARRFATVTTDRVEVPQNALINTLPAFSVFARVRPLSLVQNANIARKGTVVTAGWLFALSDTIGNLKLGLARATTNVSVITSDAPLNRVGEWFDVLVTFDFAAAQNTRIYVGNEVDYLRESLLGTNTQGTGAQTSDAAVNLGIGNAPGGATATWPGDISRFMLFNRVLTRAEGIALQHDRNIQRAVLHYELGRSGSAVEPTLSGQALVGTVTGTRYWPHPPSRRGRTFAQRLRIFIDRPSAAAAIAASITGDPEGQGSAAGATVIAENVSVSARAEGTASVANQIAATSNGAADATGSAQVATVGDENVNGSGQSSGTAGMASIVAAAVSDMPRAEGSVGASIGAAAMSITGALESVGSAAVALPIAASVSASATGDASAALSALPARTIDVSAVVSVDATVEAAAPVIVPPPPPPAGGLTGFTGDIERKEVQAFPPRVMSVTGIAEVSGSVDASTPIAAGLSAVVGAQTDAELEPVAPPATVRAIEELIASTELTELEELHMVLAIADL